MSDRKETVAAREVLAGPAGIFFFSSLGIFAIALLTTLVR